MNSTYQDDRLLLHLGCGPNVQPSDWIDFDGSWNARMNGLPGWLRGIPRVLYLATGRKLHRFPEHVRYLDLNRPLPFASESADAIYASHVWEHLYLDVAEQRTRECHRVLKPGGLLRLVVPDLAHFIADYVANPEDSAAHLLNQNLLYRELAREKSFVGRLYTALTDLHSHKFMYDSKYMRLMLEGAGFRNVQQRTCHESDIPEIAQVESPGRCSPSAGFAVEGTK